MSAAPASAPSLSEPNNQKWQRIRSRLAFLYGEDDAPAMEAVLQHMVTAHLVATEPVPAKAFNQRDALLISYGDSVTQGDKNTLPILERFLSSHVGKSFTYLHLLPFYPYSSDDGFSVIDFEQIRKDLGSWDDVRHLSSHYGIVFDAVLNHVSAKSKYVRGFLEGDPDYADFLVSPKPTDDLSKVVRPRDLPLLHEFTLASGEKLPLWTTFSPDQVDLNFRNPRVFLEIIRILLFYAASGASMLRLDAIPYLWKAPGTMCVHLKETHAIIKLIRDIYDLAAPHMVLLSETNVPHEENISYFGQGGDEAQIIYNFSLAPLALFAITSGNTTKLTRWAQGLGPYWRGCTWLNITATHDGIGMRPTEGILDTDERQLLVETARKHGGQVSYKRNSDGSTTPYELNVTYFDAVNDPSLETPPEVEVARFLVTQAIAMAIRGIPGIYIHSLLGSRNNNALVAETGRLRSINRTQLDLPTLEAELEIPTTIRHRVLNGMRRLLDTRGKLRAFHPDTDQQILDLGSQIFAVLRRCADTGERVLALHNVTEKRVRIDRRDIPLRGPLTDTLSGQLVWLGAEGEDIVLLPYQVAWLS